MAGRMGRRFLGPRRGPRKRTVWESLNFDNDHPTTATRVINDLTPEPNQTDKNGTAKSLRSLLNFTWRCEASALSGQQVSVGIAVVTNDAVAALVVPDPELDFQQGWLYWESQQINNLSNIGPGWINWRADIRTQRVLRGGYSMVLISSSPVNTVACRLHIAVRTLWEITN